MDPKNKKAMPVLRDGKENERSKIKRPE